MASNETRPAGLRRARSEASKQFRDGLFHNTAPVEPGLQKGSRVATMTEFFFGGERRVPRAPLPSVDPRPGWARPAGGDLRATWLGHSTVLVEIDGHRILTDPVWGPRASPVAFAGPKRFQPVPVAIDDLPQVDAVVLSHDHYDHLCQGSIVALAKRGVRIVTSLGVGARLDEWGIPAHLVTELDWWESVDVGGLRVTFTPSQHFSGRGLGDRNTTLWSSIAVRGPRHAFFFSGDTGLTPEYADIRDRLGPFDLVMLEVGAFHPSWGGIHLGPENALKAHALLGGGALLPVHWGTFNLAIHAWDEPAETLVARAPSYDARLVMPRLGEVLALAREEAVTPWWRGVDEPLRSSARGPALERNMG